MDADQAVAVVIRHWSTVLNSQSTEDDDNFFELGGDSLAAVELIQRIEADLGSQVDISVLLLGGTLGELKAEVVSGLPN